MELAAHGQTDVGLVREQNEDSVYCGRRVFAVADGLGGHAAGEVASALAIEVVATLDDAEIDISEAGARLAAAVREANRRVCDDARTNPARANMGTTLTAAMFADGRCVLAHVGDSRAYLMRSGNALTQVTQDHDVAAEAVRAGLLTPEEAQRHPERHVLTRVVGVEPDVTVDVVEPAPLGPGDRVLLCSDGLTTVVSDDQIAELMVGGSPETVCRNLVEAALARGAPDNVSVVVVEVGETPP